MAKKIPLWRLREIRNIADTIVFRAACCPLAAVFLVTEKLFLKPNAHIVPQIDGSLGLGQARSYVQEIMLDGGEKEIHVIIHFNGDLSTKQNWRATARAMLEQLGHVVLFTNAALRPGVVSNPEEERKCVDAFVEEMMKLRGDDYAAYRPRFPLAFLNDLVEQRFSPASKYLKEHIQRLLWPYLGPYGW